MISCTLLTHYIKLLSILLLMIDVQNLNLYRLIFQCSLTDASSSDTDSTEVQLTVALKAIVEFEDLFGSVEVVANQVTQLTCKAKNARPQGKFSWRIEIPGEAQPQYLTNSQNAKHDRQKNGVVTSTEVLQYLYLHVSFTHWGKIILFVHKFT